MIKLYGVPLSQPFRSVAWTLLHYRIPFEVKITVPGATSRIGSRSEAYISKSRALAPVVPLLEDGSFVLTESSAIMAYVCEKYQQEGITSWYAPPGEQKKATIDSFLHWHHFGTRQVARLIQPLLRPELGQTPREKDLSNANKILGTLERGWLAQDLYLAGNDLSIADILAYEDLIQVQSLGMLPTLQQDFPKVAGWMDRMKTVPFYDQVHVPLFELGNLTEPNDTPLEKRLAAATKAGLQALKQAQATYTTPSSKL